MKPRGPQWLHASENVEQVKRILRRGMSREQLSRVSETQLDACAERILATPEIDREALEKIAGEAAGEPGLFAGINVDLLNMSLREKRSGVELGSLFRENRPPKPFRR